MKIYVKSNSGGDSFIAIITDKEVIDVTNHVVEQLEAYAEGEI